MSKIDWSLKKTIIRKDLDLTTDHGADFDAWKRQVKGFMEESGAMDAAVTWDRRYRVLESCCERTSFKKIDALRMQMPDGDRRNVDKLLDKIGKVASSSENVWLYRHKFHELRQRKDQNLQNYYAELISVVHRCKFDDGFGDADKQRVVDLLVLNKLVFDTSNPKARSKLFEETELTLEKALKTIETYEALVKTENVFDGDGHSGVNAVRKPNKPQKSGDRFDPKDSCGKCGRKKHKGEQKCPAKDSKCNK